MSVFLFRFEAIETRVASYSCPHGTASRLHAIRLKQRFQTPHRQQSTAIGLLGEWANGEQAIDENGFSVKLPKLVQQPQAANTQQLSKLHNPSEFHGESNSETLAENKFSVTNIPERTGKSVIGNKKHRNDSKVLPHMVRAYYGDTFGLPFPDRHFPSELDSIRFREAIRGENPHNVLAALTKLVKLDNDGYKGHRILESLLPAHFSEILRLLDPDHFVGRYVELHRQISPTSPPYVALQSQKEHGVHHFRRDFLARIKSIIEARQSRGFKLSLIDYKYLLRCARAVGNPRASHAVWLTMDKQGVMPDTECYNHYLAVRVWSDRFNGAQRYRVRVLRKDLIMPEWKSWTPGSGILLKHEILKMFGKMTKTGFMGDEETFCMLMIALARAGDLDGVKSIIMKGWEIDVDRLMTDDETSLKASKEFPADSPLSPSKTLLHAVAHAFGINNAIPAALRLVDYISRKYSINIPSEVWEELLERTFVLSKRRTLRQKEEGYGTGQLPPEAVSILWDTLVSEPYNIKPTMVMYDRLIVNLLRRQRFGEVQEKIEEALNLHIRTVRQYHEVVTQIEHQSATCNIRNDGQGLLQRETIAKEHLLDLQRDRTYQRLHIHRSRQYIRRWCRLFIYLGTRSMRHNPSFSGVTIPTFMQKYMSFMPREMEYTTSTGEVKFWSGCTNFNKAFIERRKTNPKTTSSLLGSRELSSKKSVEGKCEYPNFGTLLEPSEMFGKL